MMDDKENVARLLKNLWFYDGELSPAAFNLRPQIHESYISVLRESCDSFLKDVKVVTHGKCPVLYARLNVGELRGLQVDSLEDDVCFDVKIVDNTFLSSHAGIFIYINSQQIVGGEPLESYELRHGVSADSVLLLIREVLSDYARNKLEELLITPGNHNKV